MEEKERPCGDILYFIDVGNGAEGEEIVIHEDRGNDPAFQRRAV